MKKPRYIICDNANHKIFLKLIKFNTVCPVALNMTVIFNLLITLQRFTEKTV